jgi:protein SCO1
MSAGLAVATAAITVLGGLPIAGGARDAQRQEALLPPGVRDIGIDERLGVSLPLDVTFADHRGAPVTLADFLEDEKPLLLVPAYYGCPMLCSLVLGAVVDAAIAIETGGWRLGEDYRIVAFSFDPSDRPTEALRKRNAVTSRFGARVPDADFSFLTASDGTLALLLDAIGLRIQQDPRTGEWAHPATLVVVDPTGRISTYLHGNAYPESTLKASLEDARTGLTRTPLERLLIACFRYDPASRAYGSLVVWSLRLGGIATLLALGLLVGLLIRRERRHLEDGL